MLFQSDNVSGIAPELLNAIIVANQGNRPHGDRPVVRFACSYCTSESDIQLLMKNIHRVFEGQER